METGFSYVVESGEGPWTLLLLHGTGGDEHDLVPLARQLAPDAGILSPRGKVLEDGVRPRFFRRLAVGELDIPDLVERTDELAAFLDEAIAEHDLDGDRIVAVGLSNGANIAVSLMFRHPGLLRGAALLRAMLPYEPEVTPDLAGTDVLIAAGESDPFAPVDQVRRLEEILRSAGAGVRASVTPGAGHALTPGELEIARDWMSSTIA